MVKHLVDAVIKYTGRTCEKSYMALCYVLVVRFASFMYTQTGRQPRELQLLVLVGLKPKRYNGITLLVIFYIVIGCPHIHYVMLSDNFAQIFHH